MAVTFPTVMVMAETTSMSPTQVTVRTESSEKKINETRTRAAMPPNFGTMAKKEVTGVGAPWYTSGVHMWNGKAEILYPTPTKKSKKETITIAYSVPASAGRAVIISANCMEPRVP